MNLRPTIDKAGAFPVVQEPCPFQHGFLTDLSAPPAGICHTTEGGWPGSMAVFKRHWAPHFIVGRNASGKVGISQLIPVGYGALACEAHNNKARVEIELVGSSKPTPWLPEPDTLDALASLMLVCRDVWDIPLAHPWPDGDFGRAGDNPHRHAGKLGTFAGWLGHGDMPLPDGHWDPGALEWSKVFARALQLTVPSPAKPAA